MRRTLTRREQEVAELVTQGLTNREVAQRLFISERTAESHLEMVRSKLGCHSRAEVAAWFTAQKTSHGTTATIATNAGGEVAAPVPVPGGVHRRSHRRTLLAAGAALSLAAAGVGTWLGLGGRPSGAGPPADTLSTIAGTGASGFAGDDGPAAAAELSAPTGLAAASDGTLYLIDGERVREIAVSGIIRTVAGSGTAGYSGDGGAATLADLNLDPRENGGIAVDSAGVLYIADVSNHRVRRIKGGVITTVAGDGVNGFAGDGGRATRAELSFPHGVAVDPDGTLYVADTGNNRIRRVGADGTITTIAGTGSRAFAGDGGPGASAAFDSPQGLALDADGNLYIADSGNDRVRELSADGMVVTVAGDGHAGFAGDGGPAVHAELNLPAGIAFDRASALYIADTENGRIRRVDLNGTITTVIGDGRYNGPGTGFAASEAVLNHPFGVAVMSGRYLAIADTQNNRIRRLVLTP